ncbi:MAG: SAM-dependent chlorinase/fluorinase [Nanoarchaeota archaeon]|nr:SAM-dependent chlorinase/fluorinase [Nanoarchaeota archaeon]
MIVLLTDFSQSEYVGIMKGVIARISPKSQIIDLSHQIKTVKQGAWVLLQSYKSFPENTVFLCVVDPGVGSGRKPIIVKTKDYTFIGPDNGLLWKATSENLISDIREILSNKAISSTFHGRDVFAPCAARLDSGEKTESKTIKDIVKLDFKLDDRTGEIVHIDSFGNIITNLPHIGAESYFVSSGKFNEHLLFHKTYAEAKENELFLIEGSSKTLELSIKGKDASKVTKLNLGAEIDIR